MSKRAPSPIQVTAEAGTVYAKTGLTPRQLLKQRDELLRAAILGLAFAEIKFGNLDPDANKAFEIIRDAILKASGPTVPA